MVGFVSPLSPLSPPFRWPRRRVPLCSTSCPSEPSSSEPSSSSETVENASSTPTPTPTSTSPTSQLPYTPRSSALDDLPASLKLNAVAEAVARRRDHAATLRVLSEMSELHIPLERSTQSTIVDSCVDDHIQLGAVLSRISPFGFGSLSSNLDSSPSPYGPVDPERAADLTLATGFVTVVSTALSVEVFEPTVLHHAADEATAVLVVIGLILAADRYALSAATWRRLRAGLNRLFANDPARVALTDAAAFLVAYLLGLPWLCYRPNGRRAAQWQKVIDSNLLQHESTSIREESEQKETQVKSSTKQQFDDSIIDKCLIWLVAPVAAELAVDATLINSDLSPARDFMTAARRARRATKYGKENADKNRSENKKGNSFISIRESDTRIRMAISVAARLLGEYQQTHAALTDAFLAGASAGECVSLMSDRCSSPTAESTPVTGQA